MRSSTVRIVIYWMTLASVNFAALPNMKAALLVQSGSTASTSTIRRYDETTGAFLNVFTSGNGLNVPRDMIIGPDGKLYVSNWGGNNVLRYDTTTGAYLGVFASGGGLNAPFGLKFGPDGNLYVMSTSSDPNPPVQNQVLRYNGMTGDFMDVFASVPGYPRGLTFGPDGDLYIARSTVVRRFDGATGASEGFFATGLSGARGGLVFGPDGNLYASNTDGDNVLRFNGTTGASMGVFASGSGLDYPMGLVFGPDNNLYVSSRDTNQVLRYDGTSGKFIDVFATDAGLIQPRGLVFTPVPEPSSVVLLGIGALALFGYRSRRRIRSSRSGMSSDHSTPPTATPPSPAGC